MKAFNDYASTQVYTNGGMQIPVGGYVAKVMNVKFTNGTNGNSDFITLQIDIVEGEQKDFFKKQYESNTSDDKKWKGTATIYCPKDDGTEQDGWTKRRFKTIMSQFEDSNTGFSWDWDETKLKGKLIGVIYGEINTVIDNKQVKYNGFRFFTDVQSIRNNGFVIPDPQFKNGAKAGATVNASSESNEFMKIPEGAEEEIPF